MTSEIGIFFGSSTGSTKGAAYAIFEALLDAGVDVAEPEDIADGDVSDLLEYENIVVGCPTWDVGELQDDWDIAYPDIANHDFSGKTIALFGDGDQITYDENYLDAVGILALKFREQGAALIGFTPAGDYDHEESKAQEGDNFMGLGLDETNEPEKTDDRIAAWVTQIVGEFSA